MFYIRVMNNVRIHLYILGLQSNGFIKKNIWNRTRE